MKIRKSIVSLAAASLIAASPLVMLNNAYATTTTVAETTADSRDQAIIKIVGEALKGLRQVHAARLAIFNGETDAAVKFVTAAEQDFSTAEKAVQSHGLVASQQTDQADAYIPFDMSVGLAEGFVPSEEMAGTLQQANQQFEQGNHRHAVELLGLANIDVTVSAGLIPAGASLAHVQDAIKLLAEKKYYEANLALKALEDSVIFESYSADKIPSQGQKS